jgi:RNA polymerase sigma-70 factor (ECF subfamily)
MPYDRRMSASAALFPWTLAMDGEDTTVDAVAVEDRRLVEDALADPEQFRHLVTKYQGRVFAIALRLTGNEADARDISQEAFLRAFRALGRFELGRRFAPWVCTIAANAARDLTRDPIRRLLLFGLPQREREATERASDRIEQNERERLLQAHLLKLKPKLREAVVLRYVAEMSVEEVAEALGIGVSAAKMRISRGTAQLETLAAKSGALI